MMIGLSCGNPGIVVKGGGGGGVALRTVLKNFFFNPQLKLKNFSRWGSICFSWDEGNICLPPIDSYKI